MQDYQTTWFPFVMIVLGWTAACYLLCGAGQAFFEPWKDPGPEPDVKPEKPSDKSDTPAEAH